MHGEPLGAEEIKLTREALGWSHAPFVIPKDVVAAWDAKAAGKTVAGYGAAAKGNTFLNVAGIGPQDGIAFVVDRNPSKQNTLLPGSHIPVLAPVEIAVRRPDYLVILPWNIALEVMEQEARIRDWGGRFVTAVPELKIR